MDAYGPGEPGIDRENSGGNEDGEFPLVLMLLRLLMLLMLVRLFVLLMLLVVLFVCAVWCGSEEEESSAADVCGSVLASEDVCVCGLCGDECGVRPWLPLMKKLVLFSIENCRRA